MGKLQQLLIEDINTLISGLVKENKLNFKDINAVICSGNTIMGHFLLGTALRRMGYAEKAAQALKVAVAQNPTFPRAWDKLADISQDELGNPLEADRCRKEAGDARRRAEEITVEARKRAEEIVAEARKKAEEIQATVPAGLKPGEKTGETSET